MRHVADPAERGRRDDGDGDARRVRRLMERDGLCSLMNDTKWRELRSGLLALKFPPRLRVRDLLAPAGYVTPWDHYWYDHLMPSVSLEWVELDLQSVPAREPILDVLRKVGVPYAEVEGNLRVHGYSRSSPSLKRHPQEYSD
jgi:hypothetical protein